MNTKDLSTRDIGIHGEKLAAEYVRRFGFVIRGQNISKKTGEIDILAEKQGILHFIEVKSLVCEYFPFKTSVDIYTPSDNLHVNKLRKVLRTAEWIVLDIGWEGEWQVDAVLVWIRRRDGVGKVRFIPGIA